IGQAAPAHIVEEFPAARRVFLGPWRQVQQRLLAVREDAPRGQHRLARLAQMQPLGNAIDEQIKDREFRQVAAGKRLVFRPQPLSDLADRSAAQQAVAGLAGKQCFDVAGRQTAGIHLHRQRLQLGGPPPYDLPNRRAERGSAVGNLRRAVFDPPLGAVQPPQTVAVAVAGAGRRAARVILAPQRVARLALQRFLDNQTRCQTNELGGSAGFARSLDHCLQLLACPLGCRYSLHRGAPSQRPAQYRSSLIANQAKLHPNPFSSKLRTSPLDASTITNIIRSRSRNLGIHFRAPTFGYPVAVRARAGGYAVARALATVFGLQFGFPFIGPNGFARFGGLLHLWLRSERDRAISSGHSTSRATISV